MDTNQKTYTVKELCTFLNIHSTKIYKLIESGKLKAVNISTGSKRPNWRIPDEWLKEFLNSGTNENHG